MNLVPLSFGVPMLEEALKSTPCGVLGEALSFLLKGFLTHTYGVPYCPCVCGGSATNEVFLSAISPSSSS